MCLVIYCASIDILDHCVTSNASLALGGGSCDSRHHRWRHLCDQSAVCERGGWSKVYTLFLQITILLLTSVLILDIETVECWALIWWPALWLGFVVSLSSVRWSNTQRCHICSCGFNRVSWSFGFWCRTHRISISCGRRWRFGTLNGYA